MANETTQPEDPRPQNRYQCANCGGTGRKHKNFFIIHRDHPSWIGKTKDMNDETCPVCRGQGFIWK